ncbi:MAG: hypothetical protein WKF57_15030 [Nakamurella sp.]
MTHRSSVLPAAGTDAPAAERHSGFLGSRERVRLVLVVAFLLAAAFRIGLSLSRTGPLVVGDEIGYLAHARILAGGPPIDLSSSTYYYSGSALFSLPGYWLSSDPTTIYQIALVIQALVSAAALPLLYLLTRELGISRGLALSAAVAATTGVDAVFWSNYVLTESLLTSSVILWVWLTARVVRAGPGRTGSICAVLLGLTFGLMAATHPRGVLLVAIGAITGVVLIRRIGWRSVALCGAASALALGGAFWLNVVGMRANYPTRPLSGLIPANRGLEESGVGLVDQIVSTLGQVWYVSAATGLIGLYGLAHVWILALRGDRVLRLPRLAAAVLITLAGVAFTFGSATVLLVSKTSASPDYLVYGRYAAALVPVLVAFGVIGLLQTADKVVWIIRGATVVAAGLLVVVVSVGLDNFDTSKNAKPFPIPGVSVLSALVAGDSTELHQVPVTIAAVAFFVLCCAIVGRLRRSSPLVLTTLVAAVGVALSISAVATIVYSADASAYRDGAVLDVPAITGATRIAWDTSISGGAGPNAVARLNFGFFARNAELVPFDSRTGTPSDDSALVAAGRRWKGGAIGFVELYRVPGRDIVLWARTAG